MRSLTCSFFGHRKIENNEELKQKIKEVIEDLIVKHGFQLFYLAVEVSLIIYAIWLLRN